MDHCCERMAYYIDHEDEIVLFWERYPEYLIPVHDAPVGEGRGSGIVMLFCPWCGTRLPPSRRDELPIQDQVPLGPDDPDERAD